MRDANLLWPWRFAHSSHQNNADCIATTFQSPHRPNRGVRGLEPRSGKGIVQVRQDWQSAGPATPNDQRLSRDVLALRAGPIGSRSAETITSRKSVPGEDSAVYANNVPSKVLTTRTTWKVKELYHELFPDVPIPFLWKIVQRWMGDKFLQSA